MLLGVVGTIPVTPAAAQTRAAYAVGQRVEAYRQVPGLEPRPGWHKGVVTAVFTWGLHIRYDEVDYEDVVPVDVVRPLGPTAQNAHQPPPAAPVAGAAAHRSPAAVGGACASDAGVTQAGRASKEQIFKHVIYENYVAEIDRTTTAPLKIGVTFQRFTIGAPSPNRYTAQGVEHSTAPIGAPIYPVHTQHVLCRTYNNAVTRTRFEGSYECFQDKFRAWVCPTAAGHRNLGTT